MAYLGKGNGMSRNGKRLSALEELVAPPEGPVLRVIQDEGESREAAISRAGYTKKDLDGARMVIFRKIVGPKK